MDRRTTRFLGAAFLVTATVLGITSMAGAGQVRAAGSLLGAGREITVSDCGADYIGDAVAVVPADRFDPGTIAYVSTSGRGGLASGGGATGIATATLVGIHVPAGTPSGDYVIEVKAAGTKDAKPTEVVDHLTVRVRC
jgi:hypothetical protein